jgi:hypothetical protein
LWRNSLSPFPHCAEERHNRERSIGETLCKQCQHRIWPPYADHKSRSAIELLRSTRRQNKQGEPGSSLSGINSLHQTFFSVSNGSNVPTIWRRPSGAAPHASRASGSGDATKPSNIHEARFFLSQMALGNSSHCELLQPAHEYLRNGTAIRWEADAIVNSLLGKIMFVIPAGADTLRVALRCLCEFLEVLMRDGRRRG